METYGQLKAAVADWLNREDLTAVIPSFIRLAESLIYRNLRCVDNEFTATYTSTGWNISGGPNQANSAGVFKTLPPNFAEIKLVTWNGKPLQQISDAALSYRLNNTTDSDVCYFCIQDRKFGFSAEITDDPSTWTAESALIYTYYGSESLDSLPTWQVAVNPVEDPVVSDTSPQGLTQVDENTTRMLQRNPDLYLHGALTFASQYLKEPAAIAQWSGLFIGGLEDLRLNATIGMVSGSTSQVSSPYGESL